MSRPRGGRPDSGMIGDAGARRAVHVGDLADHGLDDRAVGQRQQHQLGAPRHRADRVANFSPVRRARNRSGSVINRQAVARRDQTRRHPPAHLAEPD